MNMHTFPRAVIGSSLKIARAPVDGILRFAGDSDSTGSARLFVDRFDATVREIAGTLLRDAVLLDEAQRRQAAADEREHALRLHAEAEFHTEQGEQRAKEARQEAESQRRKVKENAQKRRSQAQKRQNAKTSDVARATQARKQNAQKTTRQREEAIEEHGKRERLEALDSKAEVLEMKQKALAAADESTRLKNEASKAKQSRKNSGSPRRGS